MLRMRSKAGALGALILVATATISPALAQPAPSTPPAAETPGEAKPMLLPRGVLLGPGMMQRGMARRMCDPRVLGLTGWRTQQLERALSLTDEQKKKLEDVATASAKAVDQFVADCPREIPLTPKARLELIDTRLNAMLEGVRTVRAAFDPFWDSLTDEQKARLLPDLQGRGSWFETRGERDRERRRR